MSTSLEVIAAQRDQLAAKVRELGVKLARSQAAVETLKRIGYTYEGGELWKPPLSAPPETVNFTTLRDEVPVMMVREVPQASPVKSKRPRIFGG